MRLIEKTKASSTIFILYLVVIKLILLSFQFGSHPLLQFAGLGTSVNSGVLPLAGMDMSDRDPLGGCPP